MAYTVQNFKTKKALKEAVVAWLAYREATTTGGIMPGTLGAVLFAKTPKPEPVRVYQPGPFGPDVKDGKVALEGPHYPAAHSWYATATVKDGVIVGKVS